MDMKRNFMQFLSRTRLLKILETFRSLQIGVVGDFTLDAYWYVDMLHSQLSRETPLFSRPVVRETYNPGGAANVASNLRALEIGGVRSFSVIGDDWRGELLISQLVNEGLNLASLISKRGWLTPLFGKVFLSAHGLHQEDARLDFINSQPLNGDIEYLLLKEIENNLPALDALIIAEYHQIGVITPRLRDELNKLANKYQDKLFFVDSRDYINCYSSMVIKPNKIEAARIFFPKRDPSLVTIDELIKAGLLHQKKNGRPIFITLGEKGVLLITDGHAQVYPATKFNGPIDAVGAGDTFLATLAACLASGASPQEAACIANLAAGITVRILNLTGTPTPEKIIELYESLNESFCNDRSE
jgi:rfaE bifunctional protein kinase chain/domain